jgi:hypothetical protein
LQGQGIAANAVGKGAFGGNRTTLAQGLNAQNYDLMRQQAIGQGYNTAFQNAQQAQQFGANLGLQGLATGLQGVNQAQQGYTGAQQAGIGLGNLGYQQNQADVARLGLQNTLGTQQYQLPYQNLQFARDMTSGLPISNQQTQGWQAPPNALAQTAGLASTALGAYGMYNKLFGDTKPSTAPVPGITGSIPNIPYGGDARDIGLKETPLSGASYTTLPFDEVATGGQITRDGVKRYASGGLVSLALAKALKG